MLRAPMSKLDQLRRQREQQHENQEEQLRAPVTDARAKSAPVEPAAPATALAPPVEVQRGAKANEEVAKGACSVCGKVRALNNGLVSNHQKGLGKMCAGSRKEPA
jgi:hypothetical protein